jgi:DNA repair photolyase
MLADAGIPTGIAVAPVIPGYNESDIPGLLERARDAGATKAFMSMLHLDSESIEEYFVQKMEERIPTKAAKIINTIKRERGGQLRHRSYKERDQGKTEQWEVTKKLFEFHSRRLGFNQKEPEREIKETPLLVQQTLF